MPLLSKFPYNKPGHQHWETMKDVFNLQRLHEKGYDGASYYEEHELLMLATPDEDTPWCCEYTKKAFVKAWDKTKKQQEFYEMMGSQM